MDYPYTHGLVVDLACFVVTYSQSLSKGLLSLTVEFFRTTTSPCPYDDSGQPLSPDPGLFNYTYPPTCQLTCSINSGPFSPIRKGSANNIYVVPAPERISFGTGTLLAGACCIPAVLHLISMWNKILKINWNWHYGNQDVNRQAPIEGTNGATIESMTKVNAEIRKYLIIPEALVFGAAVLSILVLGEMNFFSAQVIWQSEPMSAIGKRSSSPIVIRRLTAFVPFAGQWAPIVGTILAILGSLYHIRHKRLDSKEETSPTASKDPLNTTTDRIHRDESPASPKNVATRGTIDGRYSPSNGGGSTSTETVIRPLPRAVTSTGGTTPPECVPMTNPPRAVTWRDDGKRRVNRTLAALDSLATPAPNHFDDSEFRSGPAQSYPRIPAEESRNKYLNNIENRYPGNATQLLKQHSRAGSVSSARGINIEGSTTPRAQSPGRSRSDTFPAEQALGELQNATSDMSATSTERMSRRRSTLTVSSPDHQGRRLTISASTTTVDDSINQGPSSPVIVVSHDSQWPDQEDVS
jgi:hypothetical protein